MKHFHPETHNVWSTSPSRKHSGSEVMEKTTGNLLLQDQSPCVLMNVLLNCETAETIVELTTSTILFADIVQTISNPSINRHSGAAVVKEVKSHRLTKVMS